MEIRGDDQETRSRLQPINDGMAAVALAAERALVAALGGGCQLPLGAIALPFNSELDMHAAAACAERRGVRSRIRWGLAGALLKSSQPEAQRRFSTK